MHAWHFWIYRHAIETAPIEHSVGAPGRRAQPTYSIGAPGRGTAEAPDRGFRSPRADGFLRGAALRTPFVPWWSAFVTADRWARSPWTPRHGGEGAVSPLRLALRAAWMGAPSPKPPPATPRGGSGRGRGAAHG
ncbi:hypothetical protein TPA0910_81330 [Streptomyces hygroscopicus subsp. sporocinereus]|uniref:Uncharacterized protein n=1 Tax=Streptomyces hygroscopicus TaxID=1912 RepID=A0ABQ3UDM9_STRHY|nr:hypothetical protein TPA0910_81330 [Streptomyces hygroscopicus]